MLVEGRNLAIDAGFEAAWSGYFCRIVAPTKPPIAEVGSDRGSRIAFLMAIDLTCESVSATILPAKMPR